MRPERTDPANKDAPEHKQRADATAGAEYGPAYYASYNGPPYEWGERHWHRFFANIADEIVASLNPRTVLDAGCGIGFLVAALRERGVEAYGLDISDYAIEQVPAEIRDYCRVASIADEFAGTYDLISCIEVIEHIPRESTGAAIRNLTGGTDIVLFSSIPDGFREATHQNVQPMERWIELFARHDFYRDVDFDTLFVAPHAVLFRRSTKVASQVAQDYERWHWRHRSEASQLREELQSVQSELGRLTTAHQIELGQYVSRAESDRTRSRSLEAELVELRTSAHRTEAQLSAAREEVASHSAMLRAIESTATWRLSAPLRAFLERHGRAYRALRRTAEAVWPRARLPRPTADQVLEAVRTEGGARDAYAEWVADFDSLTEYDLVAMDAAMRALPHRPTISVVMAVCDPPIDYLRHAIESVLAQTYGDWELCIADDASTDPEVRLTIETAINADQRVKVTWRSERGGISSALNSGIEHATGEFVAFLDHDDVLRPHALLLVALEVNRFPRAALLYSDEDKIDESGSRLEPYFKPDWNPALLLGENYLCHLLISRKDSLDAVGGFRSEFDGAQDWDLVLRLARTADKEAIRHIPHVLYGWRKHSSSTARGHSAKPYAAEAARRAVEQHLGSGGVAAEVEMLSPGRNRIRYVLPTPAPSVDVVVPSGLLHSHVGLCLSGVLQGTHYPSMRLSLVIDDARLTAGRRILPEGLLDDPRVQLVTCRAEQFNYSRAVNTGVSRSSGAIICLLNDDIAVITPDWLEQMVARVVEQGVGAVGAMLYYPNDTIQHGGVILGLGGIAGHYHAGWPRGSDGYFGRACLDQDLSAVTAACMVVRREAFEAVGGFDESFEIAFNDVDFCLKLRQAGWRIVWTPAAELYHHESMSVGHHGSPSRQDQFRDEQFRMVERWGDQLVMDPHYSPNLSLQTVNSVAFPPRVTYAWRLNGRR